MYVCSPECPSNLSCSLSLASFLRSLQETRRAMTKSFQESGGTCLSTNWKEVSKTDYKSQIVPPKGLEVYKPS